VPFTPDPQAPWRLTATAAGGRAAQVAAPRTPVPTAPAAVSQPTPAAPSPCNAGERRILLSRIQETQTWTDTVQLADATPRIGLAPVIAKLQDLRRQAQVQRSDWPPCAAHAYDLWLQAMDAEIASRLAFSAQQPYEAQHAEADRLYQAVAAEWTRLRFEPPMLQSSRRALN
jgi:hypothetical protein